MNESGIIFDISHYMLEDGPGIRTNIFLKGCILRCKWCSNAFGLEQKIQLAYNSLKCIGCKGCLVTCQEGAISFDNNKNIAIEDFTKCTNCMKCISICPTKARTQIGREVTPLDVLKEVEKDRMFYRRSEGGVTLSGGEILLQPRFSKDVLKLCQYEGINTAIETSAMGKWDDLKGIISYCDTVFIDCKCMDRESHRELTGVYNDLIIENIVKAAEYCNRQDIDMIVRLPLIPGMNDSKENVEKTAHFVKTLNGNVLLNILPYHGFGAQKYEYIGKSYGTKDLESQSRDELDNIREILNETGVRYSIGGYNI